MSTLAHEIDDGPVVFSLLHILYFQVNQFRSSQAAPQKNAKDGTVSFAAQSLARRCVHQESPLFRCQPVAEPNAKLFHAPDAFYSGR
jgi:hypothetical protein